MISNTARLNRVAFESARRAQKQRHRMFCSEPIRRLLDLERNATHDEIKRNYLRRAIELHPDSHGGESDQFIELQSAWERYEHTVKPSLQGDGPGSFTKFGVGCSFTDSSEERDERQTIMDMAAYGVLPRAPLPPSAKDS
mmetsp:Transcript_37529/g.78955  ORF Transcript_37529/g.78955 Transcript_37529/m.78955 type:complete len:140 (+) Transcript_37529:388-807(+)